MWNVNAQEFTPAIQQANRSFRAEAPEFVPMSSIRAQIHSLIMDEGVSGIRISQIPKRFSQVNGCALDLTSCPFADLSALVASLADIDVVAVENGGPRNLADAMHAAGFNILESTAEAADLPEDRDSMENTSRVDLGPDACKIAKHSLYVNFVEDLAQFRQSIVDVVNNFSIKNGSVHHSGLALSLFAAEWDRFHSVRGLAADLKSLRDRFCVVKLMPFLQSIPELDVVGSHPEVRVRIRSGIICQSVPPSPRRKTFPSPSASPDTSTFDGNSVGGGPRNISLNSELFGTDDSVSLSRPHSPAPSLSEESQTRVVLEQMLSSTQSQIFGILSKVPSDPLSAASAIDQMNQLQVLVNALKAALAVLPSPRTPISIEDAIFGGQDDSSLSLKKTKTTLSLDSLLSSPPDSCPPSPLSAAASTAPGVGNLLADLSRILFAQVIQQQQVTSETTVRETGAALERTLAEIVSAASSPPASPVSQTCALDCSALVSGQLIIPQSLPTSPIPMALNSSSTTPSHTNLNLSDALGADAEENMHNLLKGLMSALPPPGLVVQTDLVVEKKAAPFKRLPIRPMIDTDVNRKVFAKDFLLSVKVNVGDSLLEPPAELRGLSCKQMLRTLPSHKARKPEEVVVVGVGPV